MNELDLLQDRLDKIQFFLKRTTETFDDWDYSGEELTIYLQNKMIEHYFKNDLSKIIVNF